MIKNNLDIEESTRQQLKTLTVKDKPTHQGTESKRKVHLDPMAANMEQQIRLTFSKPPKLLDDEERDLQSFKLPL